MTSELRPEGGAESLAIQVRGRAYYTAELHVQRPWGSNKIGWSDTSRIQSGIIEGEGGRWVLVGLHWGLGFYLECNHEFYPELLLTES